MIVLMPAALLALQLVAAADAVPNLNLDPTCSGARESGVIAGRTREACLSDEHGARDRLRSQWTTFLPADRIRCAQSTNSGGVPSYVELLTCLEIAKQARELPDETVGRGPSLR